MSFFHPFSSHPHFSGRLNHVYQSEVKISRHVLSLSLYILVLGDPETRLTRHNNIMCIRPSIFMRFAEGHRERWRADAVWRQRAFTIPTVNSVFTLPPSPAQQMLYQSGLTLPDCQSKSNPSFFFSPSTLKTGSAITRCRGGCRTQDGQHTDG